MPTTAVELCPPNAKPAEVVPDAAAPNLAVFKSPTSVQLEPSHDSTLATKLGDSPEIQSAAV